MHYDYGKLSAILLFALLQCFSPFLHAHFDHEHHDHAVVYSHGVITAQPLDTEGSHHLEIRVEALDWRALSPSLAFQNKVPSPPNLALSSFIASLWKLQALPDFFNSPLPNFAIWRTPFISPPSHAPPHSF